MIMKKSLVTLALLACASMASAQISGPPYNPANVKITGGTIVGVQTSGITLNGGTATNVTINGGTIDNTVIGQTNASTVRGTTITATVALNAPLSVTTKQLVLTPLTVATLPTCVGAGKGVVSSVSDAADATVYLGAVVGGGTKMVLAVCDGTAWTAH